MKQYTSLTAFCLVICLLAACNKGQNDFYYKGDNLPITFRGFNASSGFLNVRLDTSTTPVLISGSAPFNFTTAYTLSGNQNSVKLHVTDEITGKEILSKELKKEDGPANIGFLYMDGKISDWPEKPAVQKDLINIIYMFMPTITGYSEPVDIAFGKYYVTPQVFEEKARIKNLKPNEFSAPVSIPTFSVARQEYNGVMTSVSFSIRLYKAGTNTLYIDGTEYTWNMLNSNPPKPPSSTASSKIYIFQEAPVGNMMRFYNKLEQ